jgi:hypothetical protein
MKNLLIIAALAAIIPATTFAQTPFLGGLFEGDGDLYVTEDFNLGISTGVSVFYDQTPSSLAVAAGHPKGTLAGFGGSTNGGSIALCPNGFEQVIATPLDEVLEVEADPDNGVEGVTASAARAVGC